MNASRKRAASGLRLVLIAQILSLAGRLLSRSPLLGSILILAGVIMELVGLAAAASGYGRFWPPLLWAAAGLILSLGGSLLPEGGLPLTLAEAGAQAIEAARVAFVCAAVRDLLSGTDERLVRRCAPTWIIFAGCSAAEILCALLSPLALPPVIYVPLAVVSLIAPVAGRVLYASFLSGSCKALS